MYQHHIVGTIANFFSLIEKNKTIPKDSWVLEGKEFLFFAEVPLRLCQGGTRGQAPLKYTEKLNSAIARNK